MSIVLGAPPTAAHTPCSPPRTRTPVGAGRRLAAK
jgi:hypothetical protein